MRFGRALLLNLVFALLTCGRADPLDVPPLRGRVNDLAAMLSADEAERLEERLRTFEEQTSHQIVVLTLPSLHGDALEDFSFRVVEAWKIGQKGNDNGVLLLIVRDDRKVRLEVGYGLEGILPDASAKQIIQEVIVPRFRQREFGHGIDAARVTVIPNAADRCEENLFPLLEDRIVLGRIARFRRYFSCSPERHSSVSWSVLASRRGLVREQSLLWYPP